jgi:acyl-CoA thioester hydrolase
VFEAFGTAIHDDWIDYNGHMNDAAYALALTAANEAFLDHVDLGAGYRERTGCTMYTVDLHLSYKAEVQASDRLQARTSVTLLAPRKLQLTTALVRSDGTVAAIGEVLYLHYDQGTQQVTAFAAEQTARLSSWLSEAPAGA